MKNTAFARPGQPGVVPSARATALNPLPFAPIPNEAYEDRRITSHDRDLLAWLLRYARRKSSCWASVARLGSDVGRSVRSVQYSLRRLEAAGWIFTRPAQNATGREIVLAWREFAPPPVQAPYSQGLPPKQRFAPESRTGGEKKEGFASASQKQENSEPAKPMSSAELRAAFTETGALSHPETSAMRRIAERQITEALEREMAALNIAATVPNKPLLTMRQ